jgi:ElaB/YqjD/DUF883 family membrane-anchored ribosome-binding protein
MASVQEMKKTDMSTGTSWPGQQDAQQKNAGRDHFRGVGVQSHATSSEIDAHSHDKAQTLSEQMQNMGTQIKETATEYYEQGLEGLKDLNQTIEVQIRERPLQALAVAGGVGVLLGLLWLRR